MNKNTSIEERIESILGFRLNHDSLTRIKELRLKAGFSEFEELLSSCLGTLEIFLKEKLKNRVFVTLNEKYLSDVDNWDRKVWLFDIEFLNKENAVHSRNLEVLQNSRFDEPDYDANVIMDLLGKENYEDIILNSIVMVEWIVTEIEEGRIIGSVDREEFESMDSKNWRILILYTSKNELGDYRYTWDV